MLWSHIFKIGNYTLMLKAQSYRELNIRTRGMEARVPKTSLYVTFLDYDNIIAELDPYDPEAVLKEQLEFIQGEFEIGNFYVFETRDVGRHAVCIDALRFKDVKEIVDFSSCDVHFKFAPFINEYCTWVLRTENKGNRPPPKYIYTVESPFEGTNLQSLPHALFLKAKYGVNIELKNPIGTEEIRIQEYRTIDKHTKDR